MPAAHDHSADVELMRLLSLDNGSERTDALFEEIFQRYHRRIVAWCFNLTRDRESAADLAQEVLLKAYRFRGSWRGDSRLSTWLYVIARNHCMSAMARRSRTSFGREEILSPRLRDFDVVPPDVAAERRQLSTFASRLLTRALDPTEARVMALHYGFDIPLAEITARLELRNPSGAKAYVVNARRKLSTRLKRTPRAVC